jgi:hypothetical protein
MHSYSPLFHILFLPQPFLAEKPPYCQASTPDLHILSAKRDKAWTRAELKDLSL